MALSVLDLFSVGIGPSSSHTVGPMRAAKLFADGLKGDGHLSSTRRVQAELFGSLGATGRGHGSDKAVVLGLKGLDPETVAPSEPNSSACTRRVELRCPSPLSPSANSFAARIGPTVCDDDGPMPTENRSRTLRAI